MLPRDNGNTFKCATGHHASAHNYTVKWLSTNTEPRVRLMRYSHGPVRRRRYRFNTSAKLVPIITTHSQFAFLSITTCHLEPFGHSPNGKILHAHPRSPASVHGHPCTRHHRQPLNEALPLSVRLSLPASPPLSLPKNVTLARPYPYPARPRGTRRDARPPPPRAL